MYFVASEGGLELRPQRCRAVSVRTGSGALAWETARAGMRAVRSDVVQLLAVRGQLVTTAPARRAAIDSLSLEWCSPSWGRRDHEADPACQPT